MFITTDKRVGSCYLEFQFCKIDKPLKYSKVKVHKTEYWKKDSLLINYEDFEAFYKLHSDVFNCAQLPNGETGFDFFGINYYDSETTLKILNELKKFGEKHKILLLWLQKAMDNYNGFYILGI